MENKKLGQEPAFAKQSLPEYGQQGMSKRFYAACAAMQGILAGNEIARTGRKADSSIVEMFYSLADELLKQEKL